MRYRTKVIEVEALKLDQTVKIGGITGSPGDYLVDTTPGTAGHLAVVKKKEFEARFEVAEEEPVRRGGRKSAKKKSPGRAPGKRAGRTAAAPGKPALPPGRRSSPNDDKRAAARKMFEQDRKSLQEIADKIGVTYSTVWNWKTNDGWE